MTEESPRILVVDDEADIRDAYVRLVRSLGYRAEVGADGIEALAKLALGVDLVLLDAQMPKMDGFEVAERIRHTPGCEFLPIIMVTGLKGHDEHRRALEVGINDFIQKPIDKDTLDLRSRWLLELKRAQDQLEGRSEELERAVQERTAALRAALQEMAEARRMTYEAHLDTIRRLTIAAEFKDEDTGSHIERIGRFARVLADAMDLAPGTVETIRHAAPMHDVGKIGIPDHILLKPADLDEDEWTVMRRHTTMGAALLAGSESSVIQMGERIAQSHHERWDGEGYPEGLAGESIPVECRICAVVDFFDAMTMSRPYRRAVAPDAVMGMMEGEAGRRFDPLVLDAFFRRRAEIDEIRSEYLSEGR